MTETFTARQKQQALTREIGFRRRVYAQRVAEQRMKEADAKFQIAIFESMEADYRAKADAEDQAGRLI